MIGDINAEGAAEVAAEIGADGGPPRRHRPRVGAIELVAEHGPFAILVNNAGTDEFGFFADTDPGQWERVLAINLVGVFACTHAVLPGMQEARLRADRQHRLGGRPGRLEGLGRLLGRQGRRDRVHEGDRARGRPLRDHRELDRARARSRRRC